MTTVLNNIADSRFDVYQDGKVAGFVQYRMQADNMWLIYTEIEPQFSGSGLAQELIRSVLERAHHARMSISPFCPVVREFIASHPEFLQLVPEEDQQRFKLSNPLSSGV